VRSKNTVALDLSGKPTKEATFWFAVEVKDCKDHVSKKAYTVKIQKSAEHVVDLHWKASTSDDIAGYNVYRGPNGKSWTKINAGLVGSTIFDDSTVANGSTYYYAVTAVGISGDESRKTAAIKVVVP
jgi:fibronectin type 3 domain-containing protein